MKDLDLSEEKRTKGQGSEDLADPVGKRKRCRRRRTRRSRHTLPGTAAEAEENGNQSDNEGSVGSIESELSEGGSSSIWEGGSEEGRSSLTATPTSSEEGRENISGTPNSASETEVEASSTVGVTESTPYSCHFCHLAFPRLSYLKRHEQNHSDQLPFQCDFCGRRFKHKRSRDRHVKLHTGDRKYKCSHCEAAFSRSDHLKIHLKTHDTQKPFRCTICTRGYSTGAALTAHIQNHKSRVPTPLDQILKDASGIGIGNCDPTLISRLLQDSNGGTKERKKEDKNQTWNQKKPDSEQKPSPERRPPGGEVSQVGNNNNHQQVHQNDHTGEERPVPSSSASGTPLYPVNPKAESSSNGSSPLSRPTSTLSAIKSSSYLTNNPFVPLVGGKLTCPFCSSDGFPSYEAFQLHIQSIHGSTVNSDIFGLPSLPSYQASSFFSPFLSSLGSASSSRPVTCELCGARVSGVAALQRHVITAHSFTDLLARAAEGVFCAQCLLPFSNPGALAEHIKLVHTSPTSSLNPTLSLLSGVLSKRPTSPLRDKPTDLSKKPRRELPSSTLLCSQCDAPFSDFESFRSHLKTHLEGTENISNHVCPECQAQVGSERALETHLASHFESTSTEYSCHACIKMFPKPDELQKHLLDMHAHHLYRCSLCRQVFDSKVSIQVHFAVKHSNETKVHKCLKCSSKFSSQAEFESHIKDAHLQRSDVINNCNAMNPSLKDNGNPPNQNAGSGTGMIGNGFRCLLCSVSLSTETEMGAHLATHEKQFRCSLCDESFHVEFLLDRHVESRHMNELNGTHSETPQHIADSNSILSPSDFRCGICSSHFSSESALGIHRNQAHNVSSSPNKVAAATLSLFCAYCNEVCKSRTDLEAHMKISHVGVTNGRHKCNICDDIFPSAQLLAHHKLSHVKSLSGSAYCVVCLGQLTSSDQINAHQREHYQKPLPQPCVVCRQTLVAEIEVKVHAKFHARTSNMAESENDPLHFPCGELSTPESMTLTPKCSECHVKLESLEEFSKHTCQSTNQEEEIKIVDKSDTNPENDDKPYMSKESVRGKEQSINKTYQCIKCQESFVSESAIEAHVTSHLEQEGSSHFCHLCRSYFETPLRLQCHLIEHTFEGCGSFTCYICGSVFTAAARLQQHMITHGLSSKPYDCHHCKQSFFFRSELENHLPTHNELSDNCQDCEGTLTTGILSRSSTSAATESARFMCHICSFVAQSRNELLSHIKQHQTSPKMNDPGTNASTSVPKNSSGSSSIKINPQVCKTCSRKCRNGISLHLHNLTHEGGKPYLCGECGAPFTRRCEAARHPSVHKDPSKHFCSLCQKEFASNLEVFAHMQAAHGGKDVEVVRPLSRCSSCDGEMDSSDSSQNIL